MADHMKTAASTANRTAGHLIVRTITFVAEYGLYALPKTATVSKGSHQLIYLNNQGEFTMPLPSDDRIVQLANDLIKQLDAMFGEHPGFRPAHAKGILLSGRFRP